ncbi:MAG: potassium transporter [Burkholderiales bacterium]|nr:potassium transporter [Burkholderiales bacterium]
MPFPLVFTTLGILLVLYAGALLPPVIVSLIYQDGQLVYFSTTLATTLAAGMLLWLPFRSRPHLLRNRHGFVIVALMWVTMSTLSSLPFVVALGLDVADAVFEATSGFTTTGSTVIVDLDRLAPSILFYRQELQWLGGIGVIVSAIALLPMLGVGGMQLFRAEAPGPIKDAKLTPRIARTAQALWRLYLSLTVACALLYWLAGMSAFDAVAHSLTTVSTGGYSTHDTSIAYYDSPAIEAVAVIFMLLGSINFGLHFAAWRDLKLSHYRRSTEVRVFLLTVACAIVLVTFVLYQTGTRDTVVEALRYSLFEVVSVITSTGYGIDDFSVWPLLLPMLLIFMSFMGGCAASTAGGMKVVRFVILGKQASIEVQRLIHPQMVRPLKLDGRTVPDDIVLAVWAFVTTYVVTFAVVMLLLMYDGMDQVTAFGAVATCINNLGPGLGEVATDFVAVSDRAKWLLALTMLLGRLEIFTFLVLLTPGFWRD